VSINNMVMFGLSQVHSIGYATITGRGSVLTWMVWKWRFTLIRVRSYWSGRIAIYNWLLPLLLVVVQLLQGVCPSWHRHSLLLLLLLLVYEMMVLNVMLLVSKWPVSSWACFNFISLLLLLLVGIKVRMGVVKPRENGTFCWTYGIAIMLMLISRCLFRVLNIDI